MSPLGSAGNIAFLSLPFAPTGFHSPLEDPDSWFYSSYPLSEKGMQSPAVPLGDRSCGMELDTEELAGKEMLFSLLQILQPVVQNVLLGYCPVSLLLSIPHPFHAQA